MAKHLLLDAYHTAPCYWKSIPLYHTWTHWGKPATEAAMLERATANTAAKPAAHSLHLKQFFPNTLFKPSTASNKNQGAIDRWNAQWTNLNDG